MTTELPERSIKKRLGYAAMAFVFIGVSGLVLGLLRRRLRTRREFSREQAPAQAIAPLTATGLTEAEAAARLQPGQDNVIQELSQRTRRQMIRESTLTIFNLNLVGLILVQLLASRWLDAVITLSVLLLNVGVKAFQEEFARYRVQSLQQSIRPRATVIRESKPRLVEAAEIVVGDEVSAGPGDQILVDGVLSQGELVIDESLLSGDNAPLRKGKGDRIFAGSICLSGRATFQAEKVGDQRLIVAQLRETHAAREALTPIEQIMKRVMHVLLVLILLLAAAAIVRVLRLETPALIDYYIDAINVIFNLAPAGLFFMVLLTYVAATADLARVGALVRRARSVESLAHIDVMCFAKAGFLTGATVEIRPTSEAIAMLAPDEVALSRLLGDFAQTTSASNLITEAMASTFGGTRQVAQAEAASLSVDGWTALVLDEADGPRAYVLADPRLLQVDQVSQMQEDEEDRERPQLSPAAVGRRAVALVRPLGAFWKRGQDREAEGPEVEQATAPGVENGSAEEAAAGAAEREEAPPGGVFGRLRRRAMNLLSRTQVDVTPVREAREPQAEEIFLTFAHTAAIDTLFDDVGRPRLPGGLVRLCDLSYQEKIRPEALEALRTFAARGVDIKVFSPDSVDKAAELLAQINSDDGEREALRPRILSGAQLALLTPAQAAQAAADHTVFSQINPKQEEQIVRALRQGGKAVGMIGDGVSDVGAMRQADLALTRRSGSPAALSVADIVLLDDSPLVLSGVVDKGQRIVNGLLDVLKLYLTQICYMLLLIVGIPLVAFGFPYSSAQGGLIALITLTIPALGLSLWAKGAKLPQARLGRILSRFIWPAALTMGVAGLVVYTVILQSSGSTEDAQLGVTYALVVMGLMLVIFIKPPLTFAWGSMPLRADPRPTLLVMTAALLFVGMIFLPVTQNIFDVKPLSAPEHYVVIGWTVTAWALGLRFLWLVIPLEKRLRGRLSRSATQQLEQTMESVEQVATAPSL